MVRAMSTTTETETGFSGQNYFPDGMERQTFYQPKGAGREGPIREKLEQWAETPQKARATSRPRSKS